MMRSLADSRPLGQDPYDRRWQFDRVGVSTTRDNNRSPPVERISSSVSLSSLTLWCHDSGHIDLVRIGADRPAGAAGSGLREWAASGELRSYRRATSAELADEIERADVVVLDVRRDDEWSTGHFRTAVHVPLDQLDDRLSEIPDGEVWVHCASGYRASIAASLLDRAGRRVMLIDDYWASVRHEPDRELADHRYVRSTNKE